VSDGDPSTDAATIFLVPFEKITELKSLLLDALSEVKATSTSSKVSNASYASINDSIKSEEMVSPASLTAWTRAFCVSSENGAYESEHRQQSLWLEIISMYRDCSDAMYIPIDIFLPGWQFPLLSFHIDSRASSQSMTYQVRSHTNQRQGGWSFLRIYEVVFYRMVFNDFKFEHWGLV
jgi:hypothetical protein